MKIAAPYNIHGNVFAPAATLREVRETCVDLVVVGGDGLPGPMPRETLACLMALEIPVRFIQGNGERVVATHLEDTTNKVVVGDGSAETLQAAQEHADAAAAATPTTPANRIEASS